MGFAYDYYLTQTEYEETAKATRANLLMRALVLTDEDAAVYGTYLTHLPEGRRAELYYESYVQDCRERRATCLLYTSHGAVWYCPAAAAAGTKKG